MKLTPEIDIANFGIQQREIVVIFNIQSVNCILSKIVVLNREYRK